MDTVVSSPRVLKISIPHKNEHNINSLLSFRRSKQQIKVCPMVISTLDAITMIDLSLCVTAFQCRRCCWLFLSNPTPHTPHPITHKTRSIMTFFSTSIVFCQHAIVSLKATVVYHVRSSTEYYICLMMLCMLSSFDRHKKVFPCDKPSV